MNNDEIVSKLTITLYRSGAISVEGNINDEKYALALLDIAKDTVLGYHTRKDNMLVVPAHDAGLAT